MKYLSSLIPLFLLIPTTAIASAQYSSSLVGDQNTRTNLIPKTLPVSIVNEKANLSPTYTSPVKSEIFAINRKYLGNLRTNDTYSQLTNNSLAQNFPAKEIEIGAVAIVTSECTTSLLGRTTGRIYIRVRNPLEIGFEAIQLDRFFSTTGLTLPITAKVNPRALVTSAVSNRIEKYFSFGGALLAINYAQRTKGYIRIPRQKILCTPQRSGMS